MAAAFEPRDSEFERRVRDSFARQGLMTTFAAELLRVQPGVVEIEVPFSPRLTQQDDFFHAGVGIAVLDSACGDASTGVGESQKHVATILATMTGIAEPG